MRRAAGSNCAEPLQGAAQRDGGPFRGPAGAGSRRTLRHSPPSAAIFSWASLISPAPKTWRMAGQNLLDERRAGSRQPDDEHRQLAFQPEAANPKPHREEIRRAGRDHLADEKLVGFRVVVLVALAPLGELQGVALARGARRPRQTGPARPGPGPRRSAATIAGLPAIRFLQQPRCAARSACGSLPPRSAASLYCPKGRPRIVPQGCPELILRGLEIAHLLPGAAQVAVCLGEVGLQFQCAAVGCDRFVSLPWSFKTLPRLLWASA